MVHENKSDNVQSTPDSNARQEDCKTDILKGERIEREEAELNSRQSLNAQCQEVVNNNEEPQQIGINNLRDEIIKKLKAEFTYQISTSIYLDHIMITVFKDNFEHNVEQITQRIQQLMDYQLPKCKDTLSVIIHGYNNHQEKVMKFIKLK